MVSILVVEDDIALNDGIVLTLKEPERTFIQCHDLASARLALQKQRPDLIILDINLPDGSGLLFCSELRETLQAPILFLTANDLEIDMVTGLDMGGDDYITKPFSLAVLRARVNALLRRGAKTEAGERVALGPYLFDFETMEFFNNGEKIQLSKTEQKLLRLLVFNKGQTLSRDFLLNRIWEDTQYVDKNALSVTICRLREKLGDNTASPQYIKTIYGLGYSWTADL